MPEAARPDAESAADPTHRSANETGSDSSAAPGRLQEEGVLIDALRRGDEAAFSVLVERYSGAMFRFAGLYTSDAALIEDAVQEAWMGVIRGIDRFAERASLRTWLFRILLNRLRTRLGREGRLIPFSTLFDRSTAPPDAAVDPQRFLDAHHPRWPGHWKSPPRQWCDTPEEQLLARETRTVIDRCVAGLPLAQREVITLRDIEGWTAADVCSMLGITESNQRVLLHRARSKVRNALDHYFAQG